MKRKIRTKAKCHLISTAVFLLITSLLLFAGCSSNNDENASVQSEDTTSQGSIFVVSQEQFKKYEKDFVAAKDFLLAHMDELHTDEPSSIYFGCNYDEDYLYLYTNDSMNNVRLDGSVLESFNNTYLFTNGNDSYGYINLYEDKISFEFPGGTRNITYAENGKEPDFDKPPGVKWESEKYAEGWYYMSGTAV